MFAQWIAWLFGTLPPDQRSDDEHIAEQVCAIRGSRAECREQQTPGSRSNRTGDVHAQRVQRHGLSQRARRHELGHDRLPRGPHHRRTHTADERQRNQDFDRQRLAPRQQHQRAADHGQSDLDHDQEAAPVEDVGEHTGRNR